MKAHLLKVPYLSDSSFSLKQYKQANINSRWHFHPEIELIRIHEGSGTQFIGDKIRRFKSGEICLVGSNIPHFWRYDDFDKKIDEESVCSTVIHFNELLWGNSFILKPENYLLKNLIEKSKRGLLIKGQTKKKVVELIEKLNISEGTFRIVYLLECLAVIAVANSNEVVPLSSLGFHLTPSVLEHERINTIYDYSFKNFKEKIPLDVIASKVGLVPSSFCRYFKSKTGKSFTEFIIELKVSNACKLLQEDKLSVKEICYESGFNNFSSFHKHFKLIKGVSPQKFKKSNSIKPLS
jgi:AraC-like DNA-binding protein